MLYTDTMIMMEKTKNYGICVFAFGKTDDEQIQITENGLAYPSASPEQYSFVYFFKFAHLYIKQF